MQRITLQAQAILLSNVGKQYNVFTLTPTIWAGSIGSIPTRADIHNLAQPFGRQHSPIFSDKLKPHGFWLAKNCVAFFNTFLLSYDLASSCAKLEPLLRCMTGHVYMPENGHVIYDGQWRGSDRFPLGRDGPLRSMVAPVFFSNLNGYMGFGPA